MLDLSRLHPGGYCTRMLADLGADVVKVERPGVGDLVRLIEPEHDSPSHVALNRGKRSIALDLRSDEAGAILERLFAMFDVVVESFRPGDVDAENTFAVAERVNPAVIWCSITGFGKHGRMKDEAGHDNSFLARSGLLHALTPPATTYDPAVPLALPISGLMAATGIVSALFDRVSTGKGAHLDIAIVDAATWLLSEDVARVSAGLTGAGTNDSQLNHPARRNYRCADDRVIALASPEPNKWSALCDVLELQAVEWDNGDPELREGISRRIARKLASRPSTEWLKIFHAAGVTASPALTTADVLVDDYALARKSVVEVEGRHRRLAIDQPIHGFMASATRGGALPGPPDLGEHTDAVLREAGFSMEELHAFRARGAIQ